MSLKKRKKKSRTSSTDISTSAPDWDYILDSVQPLLQTRPLPSVSILSREAGDPFQILISTVISLRTRDQVTLERSKALFAECPDAHSMRACGVERIRDLIYPAGFYRTKARTIHEIARIIVEEYQGMVPAGMDGLLALPGVGRKTANLVLGLGFGIPAICVDIHVHRIPNRMGLVRTKKPEDTERALRADVPEQRWIELNETLVAFGQTVCTPTSPHCSRCPFRDWCPRIGVERSR